MQDVIKNQNITDIPLSQKSGLVRIIAGCALGIFLLILGFNMELTYFRLHLFMLAPILAMIIVPPVPLLSEPREIKVIGYTTPLVIAVMAVIFSTVWDNIIASKGVWTFQASTMVGTAGHIPYEEYFWFIDHTLIASVWTLSLWSTRKTRSLPPTDPAKGIRIAGTAACLLLTIIGAVMVMFDSTFFLGIILIFMLPVIGYLWWIGGHLFMQQLRELILGVSVVSIYVLILDSWAVREGVWAFSETYTTGIKLMGVTLEQLGIYSLTTCLVAPSVLVCLRVTEIILQQGFDEKSIWKALLKSVGPKCKLGL